MSSIAAQPATSEAPRDDEMIEDAIEDANAAAASNGPPSLPGPSRDIPTQEMFVATMMQMVVQIFLRGHASGAPNALLAWGSPLRVLERFPSRGILESGMSRQDRSSYRSLFGDVTPCGIPNYGKDWLVDLAGLSPALRVFCLVLAKIGVPVPVPVFVTGFETSGAMQDRGHIYPPAALVRCKVVEFLTTDVVPAFALGATLGHELVGAFGPLHSVLIERAASAITADDIMTDGSPFVRHCIVALRQLVSAFAPGPRRVPNDIGFVDIMAIAPIVLNVWSDGTDVFGSAGAIDAMSHADRFSKLVAVFKLFDGSRHDWASIECNSAVLRALSLHASSFQGMLSASPDLSWMVSQYQDRQRAQAAAYSVNFAGHVAAGTVETAPAPSA